MSEFVLKVHFDPASYGEAHSTIAAWQRTIEADMHRRAAAIAESLSKIYFLPAAKSEDNTPRGDDGTAESTRQPVEKPSGGGLTGAHGENAADRLTFMVARDPHQLPKAEGRESSTDWAPVSVTPVRDKPPSSSPGARLEGDRSASPPSLAFDAIDVEDGGLYELSSPLNLSEHFIADKPRAHYPMGIPPAPKPAPSTTPVVPNEAVPPTLPSGRRKCYQCPRPSDVKNGAGIWLCGTCFDRAVPR